MATSSISATLSPLTLRSTSSTSTKHDFSTPSLLNFRRTLTVSQTLANSSNFTTFAAPQALETVPESFQIPTSIFFSFSNPKSPKSLRKWWKRLTITHSHADEATSAANWAIEPVNDADASLAVKKKATDISANLKGTSIFLIGMNSSMKTSVGKLIADVLRYYYFDSDSLVEEAAGEDSSGRSFKDRDEDGFHESETEVLKQLSSLGRLVVNAGNGAVQSRTNLALLRHGISVWIDVPLDMIAKDFIQDDQDFTPDSSSEELDKLVVLYEENREGYATADATISLQTVATKLAYDEFEQVTPQDMALEVLKQIEKLTRLKKMMEEAGRPF
ncbi:probable inactive shikimate kinase like 1, chloroplastic [Amaranthus tricolor]|uniref:probable inactive shikimate kinase like 1, chloroplastic n=1 Tax=Amaranthus tricolor TaxID=29722 RepID=UPI00258F2253|nr:probable inactive shikimate kinase like 1, chloroplastic [Amaranthus tricolor]